MAPTIPIKINNSIILLDNVSYILYDVNMKEKKKTYKVIGYDNLEKEYVSTEIKAKNEDQAINEINELPVNDLFFNYHGNKKPKFKGKVIDITIR